MEKPDAGFDIFSWYFCNSLICDLKIHLKFQSSSYSFFSINDKRLIILRLPANPYPFGDLTELKLGHFAVQASTSVQTGKNKSLTLQATGLEKN